MAMTEAHNRASAKWNASRDNIMLRPTKEHGQRIREAAATAGLSVQRYVLAAVDEKMSRKTEENP